MKSYYTLFNRIVYYFLPAYLSFFFFFPLSFILPDIFSLFNFFPSALPLFSVLSLCSPFSIARKKEITWVEHGMAWVDEEAPIWVWVKPISTWWWSRGLNVLGTLMSGAHRADQHTSMMIAFCANLHSSLLMVLCRSSLQFGFCADQQIIFVLVQFFPKSLNR
jgi:hypothetical protein